MKHIGTITGLITALLFPLLLSGQAFAETETLSASQQIVVTAVVPSHRDIILDNTGHIVEIDSNTLEDVTPLAYHYSATPGNQVELTAKLLSTYRQLVPEGTAKYGVLYKQSPLAVISRNVPNDLSAATVPTAQHTDISVLFQTSFIMNQTHYVRS